MFNTNLTLTVPSLLVMDGGTPRTPEILNSLMAMTSPLEYSYPVNTSQTSLNDSHSNSSDSPLDSPASQHHPHHQQQLYHHQTRKTPSVQQTRSQLIKEGVKLLIQNKRKHSGGDSSDGNESSTPLPKVSRRREPSGTDQQETSDDDMDSKSSPRSTVALTPEDEDRRRRRRERNKIAATKCRMKKRERTVNLINESETLDAQNKELKSQVSKLESERRKLLEVLQAHGPKCVHQKGYQPLPALSSITSSNRNLNDLNYLDPNAGAEQGAAEIKYSECLKSTSTAGGGSALQSFAKQDPDGVLLPPGYCKLSPTEPNSYLLENATADLATTGETNGNGTTFLARGQKSAYAGASVSSSSSSSTSTTVNQTNGKSRAKPGPKPRQSRAQSSAAPKVTSTTVSATPVTTNATSLSSLPYVSKGGNPLMTASLMATTPSSSPASLPSPVTMSSSCSSVSVSNPILTLTAAAHDTDFMLKNELIDTSSPYTTVQSADRFLFDATLDLYNNNAHSPLTAGLNCGSTPQQQQQQQQQNHHLAQNNVTLNNNNPNLVNENDRLNHLSAIKDNTSNTLLEFGVSFDALKPATVDYQQQQQQQQQHQATNDMNHHHHHHHPQQQLHGATMLGGDPTLSHLLHQQQHQNHQQQHQHHQHQQHLLQQQHQLQLQQLQQQHQQHQQQLVSNALDLLCPVANEFLLLPDEDPSEFTDLDSGITAYNSINGCLA